MSYTGDSLSPLFEPDIARSVSQRMTIRGGGWLLRRVKANTPVYEEFGGGGNAWISANRERGRAPGTLRRSWYRGPLIVLGDHMAVDVSTDDEIASFVEFPTRPHIIRPRFAKALRFRTWPTGAVRYASVVHHPGTRGSYMMLRSVTEAEAEFHEIVEPELEFWVKLVEEHFRTVNA